MTTHSDARDALQSLRSLTDDDMLIALRALLIDRAADPADYFDLDELRPDALDAIRRDLAAIDAELATPYAELTRHAYSELLLDHSLCPMHAIDYAICFDDDNAECATIRQYFPSHDT